MGNGNLSTSLPNVGKQDAWCKDRVTRGELLEMNMKKPAKDMSDDMRLFEMQARICKALANPTRLHILYLLEKREWAVSDLKEELGVALPNLSQHLAVLKAVGIVETRREGKRVFCYLHIAEVKQACGLVRSVLRRQIQENRRLVA
jgi:DNA-binding transcriptional ArsR family regulator